METVPLCNVEETHSLLLLQPWRSNIGQDILSQPQRKSWNKMWKTTNLRIIGKSGDSCHPRRWGIWTACLLSLGTLQLLASGEDSSWVLCRGWRESTRRTAEAWVLKQSAKMTQVVTEQWTGPPWYPRLRVCLCLCVRISFSSELG